LFIFSNGYIICYKPICFSCCITLHKFPYMGLFKLVAHCNTINPKLTLVRVGIMIVFRIVYFKIMFQPSCENKVLKPYWSSSEYVCFPTHFCYFRLYFISLELVWASTFSFLFLFSVVGIEKNVSWSLYWRTNKFVNFVQLWYVATFSLDLVVFCAPKAMGIGFPTSTKWLNRF